MNAHLLSGFFQHAYVTTDLARAKQQFTARWGIPSFLEFASQIDLTTPRGTEQAHLKIALAFVGPLQIELIEPLGGPGTAIYRQTLPSSGYKVAWHHCGYRLPGHASAWQEFRSSVGGAEYPLALEGHIRADHGEVRFAYLDTLAELGHYSEYIWASFDIDAAVPRTGSLQ